MTHGQKGRLKGRVAIVTGGAKGIGKAICEKMVDEEATVVIIDVSEADLHETCSLYLKNKRTVEGFVVDITNKTQVEQAVCATAEKFGTVDILVNNAGVVCPAPLEAVVEEDWNQVVAVNLKGATFCAQAAASLMKQKRYGRIINIGSRACLGKFDRTVYSATKAGLIGMTRTWALELAPYNITVNWIGPGLIATDLFRQVNPAESQKTKNLISAIPLQRVGEPHDVANAVSFLAADEAAYITGQTLFVCGGLSIFSSPI
jgi:NAD(P)-dependent dehydrogenase (short-subunit alcohol dehydrogenase family)